MEYPPESVVSAPTYLKSGASACASRYATLQILAPESTSFTGASAPQAADGSSCLFTPSEEAELMLTEVLNHLQRRGAIWTLAGSYWESFDSVPSTNSPLLTLYSQL